MNSGVGTLLPRLCFAAFAMAAAFASGTASGQAFPSRSITLLTPFPPGSSSDLIPRLLAPLMSRSMGVPVVVENRPGAGGSIGSAWVAKSEPNGYVVLMAPTPVLAINQWLYKALPYSPEKDLIPVINAATTPDILVVHPSLPVTDLKGLIAMAKAKPGELSFGSGGSGTTGHLCAELLNLVADIRMEHIPYKGPALAHQDVLAGRVPVMCDNLSNMVPHVRSGKLRAIVLTAKTRHSQVPDVPTSGEAGLPGFEVDVWFGFAVPAGTPKPVVDRLNREFAAALGDGAVRERLGSLGLTVVADSPEAFAKFVAAESAKWRKVVQASGARAD